MATSSNGLQRIVRLPEILSATGWARSTLYAKINDGSFPRPIKLDPAGRSVGWPEADVLAHQQARIAARDTAAA